MLGSYSKAGFDFAFPDRKSVIEFSRVGEVSHAELVEPFQRTWLALSANQQLNLKSLDVHRGHHITVISVRFCSAGAQNNSKSPGSTRQFPGTCRRVQT